MAWKLLFFSTWHFVWFDSARFVCFGSLHYRPAIYFELSRVVGIFHVEFFGARDMEIQLLGLSEVKGQQYVTFSGYKFRKLRETNKGDITWKCLNRNCLSTVVTDTSAKKIIRDNTQHNHPVSIYIYSARGSKQNRNHWNTRSHLIRVF